MSQPPRHQFKTVEELAPTTPRTPRPCAVLPREARELLLAASQVLDPLERRKRIDASIDYVKQCFPQFFQPQPLLESE